MSTRPDSDLDNVARTAELLDPDDRMRLIARVWASLPEDYWAAPGDEDRAGVRAMLAGDDRDAMANLPRRIAWHVERDAHSLLPSKVYSAPRRFDLSTIFVVTFAYSILFAVMSGLKFPPGVSLAFGGFITAVGIGQALLFGGRRPRLASVLTGAGLGVLGAIAFWMFMPSGRMVREFLVVMMFGYSIQGAILGYIAGVMVGGVFLIADVLRRYCDRRVKSSTDEAAIHPVDVDSA